LAASAAASGDIVGLAEARELYASQKAVFADAVPASCFRKATSKALSVYP